ncbi:hypothetical protein JCM1840_007458 [Sporobolomyces johnsonii]
MLHITYPPVPLCTWHCVFFHMLNAYLTAIITTPVPVTLLALAATLFVGLAWTIRSFRSRSRSSARLSPSNRSNLELPPGGKRPALSQLDIVSSRLKDELATPKSPRSTAETSEGAPAPMVRPIAQVARPPALAALPLDFASISRSSCPRTRSHTACAETSKGAPAPSGRLPAHVARRHPALLSLSKSHTDPNLLPPTADAPYLEQYARALRVPRDHFEDAGHHKAAFIVASLRRVRQSRRQRPFFPP